jgi:hypothetical protein
MGDCTYSSEHDLPQQATSNTQQEERIQLLSASANPFETVGMLPEIIRTALREVVIQPG